MVPSPPRALWGWTHAARFWLSLSGTLAALGLIAIGIGVGPRDRPVAPVPPLVVDLNTAPPVVLTALPHLGPAMVGRIVAERNKAPFRSLEDLQARVHGIGPATVASLQPFLQIEPLRKRTALEPSRSLTAQPVATVLTRPVHVQVARTP